MKLIPGRSASAPLMLVALLTRMFWSLQLNYSRAQNASWLCPLLGLVFYLPFAFAATQVGKIGLDSAWKNLAKKVPGKILHVCEIVFAVLLIADCAASLRLLANIASVMALGDAAIASLVLPLALVLGIVVMYGGDAAGNGARFWIRLMPLLLIVMGLMQFEGYNPAWLAPVFGGSIKTIIGGALYCAGCMILLTLLWLVSVPDRGQRGPLLAVSIASVSASVLLALHQMLMPVLADTVLNRGSAIEMLLGNGRVTISLQLLLIIIWYGNMLHLIAAEGIAASCYINHLLPKLPVWGIALFVAVVTDVLGCMQSIHTAMRYDYFLWDFMIIGAALLVLMICAYFRKGGIKDWEKSGSSSAVR